MAETYGLSHLALAVSDPRRSAQFYADAFGCSIAFADEDHGEIHVNGRRDVISFERSAAAGTRGGIDHFGFRLVRPEGIDAAVDRALAAGATLQKRGEFSPGQPYAFVEDPDGYTIEIWFE